MVEAVNRSDLQLEQMGLRGIEVHGGDRPRPGKRERDRVAAGRCDDEEVVVALERERAAKGVSPSLLARYDRIRRGKAPLAIYPLHGSSCGNCFTAVPTQRKALIQRGATIEGCEACGVLLYAKE